MRAISHGHAVHIKMTEPNDAEILLDGQPVKGCRAFEFKAGIDVAPTFTMTIIPSCVEIDTRAEVVTHNPEEPDEEGQI